MESKTSYQSVAELVASVDTILTLPEVYLRVKDVVEDPDSCLSDLVNAISIDPGITVRLLSLVNSAYYCPGVAVDNIRQAVNLLGMSQVHDLVLAATLPRTFARSEVMHLDLHRFWLDSVRRAVFARLIAGYLELQQQERVFIDGLLSDIGHQVMYMKIPAQAVAARDVSSKSGKSLALVEQELLGFDYAEVGAELLQQWAMPDSISGVVRQHLHPGQATQFKLDSAIVHIAHVVAPLMENELSAENLQQLISAETCALAGITVEELVGLYPQALTEIYATTGMLLGGEEAA